MKKTNQRPGIKKISEILPAVKHQVAEKPSVGGFSLDKKTFLHAFNYYSGGKYVIDSQNKELTELVFKYFLNDDDFLKSDLIKSEPSLDKGLLIFGDYGTGKTFLFETIHKIGRELITKKGYKNLWFNAIAAGSFNELYMNEVTKKQKNQATTFDLKTYYKGQLYIDDLGHETTAFNRFEVFEQVLFERYRNRSRTFVTTNLKPSEIGNRYGARIGDRLPEMFNIISFKGDSRRK